ncbi:HAD family hydrolase [Amycolatopsis sp. YIM 10]|uniref:HAD family hydrolase n=1 Tax=Amycolatopsis sp. YIM 10 TaxID=2653857 RepID=UPI001D151652|nr:HAD family hydrolase [Amycolatopsis sp. YIM 10]
MFFDVGEVLVNETREYGTWADWLGVSRHEFSAVFGSVIAAGRDYRDVFQVFRPGFNLTAERQRRAEAGKPETFDERDLYPDVRDCLSALRRQRILVGVSGNQTARAEGILRDLDLPLDVLGTSSSWGVEKPSEGFFSRLLAEADALSENVLYVGDRLDWDVRPAQALGLKTALIRRGPWGRILKDADAEQALLFDLPDLRDLANLVEQHNAIGEVAP